MISANFYRADALFSYSFRSLIFLKGFTSPKIRLDEETKKKAQANLSLFFWAPTTPFHSKCCFK